MPFITCIFLRFICGEHSVSKCVAVMSSHTVHMKLKNKSVLFAPFNQNRTTSSRRIRYFDGKVPAFAKGLFCRGEALRIENPFSPPAFSVEGLVCKTRHTPLFL